MSTDLLEPAVSPTPTPLSVFESAAALAAGGLFSDYLVYECGGDVWFGGGVERSLTVFFDRIESRHGDQLSVKKHQGDDLCQLLARELASWPGKWQASGWACFEFAYALKAPELLSEDERAGKVALLHLCQPVMTAVLTEGQLDIRGNRPELNEQARKMLQVPAVSLAEQSRGVAVPDDECYRQAVAEAVQQINRGALDKVILSRRLELDFPPDFVATWLHGRRHNTPSRSFVLNLGGWRAAGFSPEVVLSVDPNRHVVTEPLAGTRRMDGMAEEDLSRFAQLYRDPKETHEHAISVRLSFDEIEQVCEPSSIGVRRFMERKARGSVQHLASTVTGQLRENCNAWHAFASLFPAVTASGIPKKEAFAEIRRGSRVAGVYTLGPCFGWITMERWMRHWYCAACWVKKISAGCRREQGWWAPQPLSVN